MDVTNSGIIIIECDIIPFLNPNFAINAEQVLTCAYTRQTFPLIHLHINHSCTRIRGNSVSTLTNTHSWLVSTPHSVPSSCTLCQPVLVVSTSDKKHRYGLPFKVLTKQVCLYSCICCLPPHCGPNLTVSGLEY